MLYEDINLAYNFIKGTDFDDAPLDLTLQNLTKLGNTLNCFSDDYNPHPKNESELEVCLKRFGLEESFSEEVVTPYKKKNLSVYTNVEKGLIDKKR